MYSGRYQSMLFDALVPSLKFSTASTLFAHATQNETGEINIEVGVMVPDYQKAINYYLLDHPKLLSDRGFEIETSAVKVKSAYTYLWDGYTREIDKAETKHRVQPHFDLFECLKNVSLRYKSIRQWMIAEREQILKKPAKNAERVAFYRDMDQIDHFMTLLTCLNCACTILDEGLELTHKRLQIYSNAPNYSTSRTINTTIQPGFDTHIVEEHRAKLMPYLKKKYDGTNTENLGHMLYALAELEYSSLAKLTANKTKLHSDLTQAFSLSQTRQALNTAIQRLDSKQISEADKLKVAEHKAQIESFMNHKTPAN